MRLSPLLLIRIDYANCCISVLFFNILYTIYHKSSSKAVLLA